MAEQALVILSIVASLRLIENVSDLETAMVHDTPAAVRVGTVKVGGQVLLIPIDTFIQHDSDVVVFPNAANNPVHHETTKHRGLRGILVKPTMIANSISAGIVLKTADVAALLAEKGVARALQDTTLDLAQIAEALQLKSARDPSRDARLGETPSFIPRSQVPHVDELTTLFTTAANYEMTFQATRVPAGDVMEVYYVHQDSDFYRALQYRQTEGQPSMVPNGRVGVCSDLHDLRHHWSSPYWDSIVKRHLPRGLDAMGRNIAIRGVLDRAMAKVRTNRGTRRPYRRFRVTDIVDLDTQVLAAPPALTRPTQNLQLGLADDLGRFSLWDIGSGGALATHGNEGRTRYTSLDGTVDFTVPQHWRLSTGN